MEAAIQYFLQFSIAITLFYVLYLLILKNETFYQANRFYLVSGLLLAILLPLFPISYATPISLGNNSDFFSLSENQLSGNASTTHKDASGSSWTFIDALILIYALGIISSYSRLLWQTIKVFRKIKGKEYKIIEGIKVIDQPDVMPYSFFNVVFIDIQKYSERELSNIIAHERVHIRERHWIDLLTIELLSVLFWMNPVVWLYKRSIKQNHEYLADQGVLLAGYRPGQYQALLINQLMGVKVLGFAHNLNFSLNKKRMEMMKKEKSPSARKMKLLLALPIIALLVFAFAKKEYVRVNAEKTPSASPLTFEQNAPQKDLIKVNGKVVNAEGIPLTGANVILKGTNNGTVVDKQGEFELETPEEFSLVVSYIGYKTFQNQYSIQGESIADVKIKMEKRVFNVELPDLGNDEKLVGRDIVEVPPPRPPKEDKKGEVFTIVEDMPNYKDGGMYQLAVDIKELTTSIMKNTPDRGEVIVGFTVAADGSVVNPQVVKSSNSKMLDGSAIKIVQKLDNWNPGIQRGKKVPVDLTVPVKFE